MLGFKSYTTTKSTMSGIEIMHMIHKGQIEEIRDVLSEVDFISRIMGGGAWLIDDGWRCLSIKILCIGTE